jgi:regulation of enolase protein 1 (concanavalin A-like superfamily)
MHMKNSTMYTNSLVHFILHFFKKFCSAKLPVVLLIVSVLIPSTMAQGVIENYTASWVANSFGRGDGKWVQNYINAIRVDADGTVLTTSHWDEGGRRYGIYKDGDVIGNQQVTIDGNSVVIDGKTWSISDTYINGPDGKTITDVVNPTSLSKDNENRLMVTEEGPRQQLLFYDVSDEPILVETFGVEGGIGAHLSIGYSVGEKYPAGEYPRGIYHPYKLWGMTGCGMDDRGRIFISTSQNGTVLRAFEKNNDGEWMLDWELFGLFFVDAMDVDPYTDGIDTYGVSEHFRMDYTKDGGREWRLHGYTVDPVKYPDDPRLFEEIKAGMSHSLTTPFIRYLNGVKFMFVKGMYSQLNVFRFEDNGQICYHVKTLPSSFSWWIDQKGDYWQSSGNKIEKWTFTGAFDEKGAPVHVKTDILETDNSIANIERVIYDDKKDILYVGAYSSNYPKTGSEWGILGRVVYRFEDFTTQKKLTPGYPIVLTYDVPDPVHQRVFAKDFTIAGDKLFIIWFIRGPYYLEQEYIDDSMRGEISVHKASTGEYQGAIIPTDVIGGPRNVGWIDIPNPAVAFERSNGEIILFVEDDYYGKNILYRICESGNCENEGYIIFDSPKMYSMYSPDDEITINTDYRISEGISKVEFYANETLIGEVTSHPFNLTWSTNNENKYRISAKAYTSDDNFVQSSNSPMVYVYTPRLDSLEVNPQSSTIPVNGSVTFAYMSYDQFDFPFDATATWEFTGGEGSISEEGVFIAESTGTFTIFARSGDIYGTATVSVYESELASIKIHPANAIMYPGRELQFQIQALDQFETQIMADVEWVLFTGEGSINEDGIFIAGNSPGKSQVIASVDDITDTLEIKIIEPTGWVNQDIGAVGIKGGADIDPENDLFVVRGSGADIWGTSDQFHYVYKPLDGDGSILARVDEFNNTDSWAKVGLMIRKNDNPNSSHASVFITAANGIVCQFRRSDGGESDNVASGIPGGIAPYWLRLDRSGDNFTASASSDGIIWKEFHNFTLNMPDTVLIGLAATSHNNGSLLTAIYSHVISEGFNPVRVSGIVLNKSGLELDLGTSEQLTATLLPYNATINKINWLSTKPDVASVNQTGQVTALAPGETFIIVTSIDGSLKDTCTVVVTELSTNIFNEKYDSTQKLELYPNPASDCISIVNLIGESHVSIINTNGQVISQFYTVEREIEVNVSSLKNGIYMIRATNKSGLVSTGRFVKQ